MRQQTIRHEFVDEVPSELEDGLLYISIEFETTVHLCCCGCGTKVVTPLSPTDWTLSYDGDTVSLDPSIGNWSFPCQSHYWIRRDQIVWARQMSKSMIEAGRTHDQASKDRYFGSTANAETDSVTPTPSDENRLSLWSRFRGRFLPKSHR
jgi:Family of unknown function (DUF6527)